MDFKEIKDKIKIDGKTYNVLDLFYEANALSSFLEKSKSYKDYVNSFWEYFNKTNLRFKDEIRKWMILTNNILLNPSVDKQILLKNHNRAPYDIIIEIPVQKLESYYFWFFINYKEDEDKERIIDYLKEIVKENYLNDEDLRDQFDNVLEYYKYLLSPKGVFENKEEWKRIIHEANISMKLRQKTLFLLEKVYYDIKSIGVEQYKKDLQDYLDLFKKMKEDANKQDLNFSIFFPMYPFIKKSEIKELFISQSYNSLFELYFSELDNVGNLSFYNSNTIKKLSNWVKISNYFVEDIEEVKKPIEVINITRPQKIKDIRDLKKRFALLKAVEEYTYNVLLDDLGNFYNILKGEFNYWEIYDEPFLGKPLIKLKEPEVILTYKLFDKETREFVELEERVNFNFNYNYHLINLTYLAYKPIINYIKQTKEDEFSLLRLRDIYYKEVEHKFKVILYEKIPNDPVLIDFLNVGIVQAVSTIIQFLLDKFFDIIKEQMRELIQFYVTRINLLPAIFGRFKNGFSTINYVVGGTRTGKSLTAIMFAELLSFILADYIKKERKDFEGINQGDIIFSVWRHLIYNFRRLYQQTTNLNHFVIDEIVGTLHKSATMSKVQRRFTTFIDTQAVRRSILWLVLPQFSSISKEARSKGNFLIWKESREKLRIYYLSKSFISESDKIYSPKIEEVYQKYFKFLPVLPHNFLSYNLIEADGKNKIKREISRSAEEMELSF